MTHDYVTDFAHFQSFVRCLQAAVGCAMVEAVGRSHSIAEGWVWSQVSPRGICGGQGGTYNLSSSQCHYITCLNKNLDEVKASWEGNIPSVCPYV